ncbi:MAG: PAS domain-containing protein, partial [Anaerolineales bacterium]
MQPHYDILDHMLEGCQIIGFDWRYLYINAAAARHGRRTPDELLGRTMMEMYPGIEGTATYALLQRCLQERVSLDTENEFTFPDGTTGWFELRIHPVPEGVFVLSIDITARKQAEQEIEQQLNRLKSLRAIDLAILSPTDSRLALKTVLEETINQLQVDAAAVFLFNPYTLMLEIAKSIGFHNP